MEVNLIGIAVLTVIVLLVSMTLIHSFGGDLKEAIPDKISDVFNRVRSVISPGESYNICEAYSGKTISLKEFQTILQASYNGECGNIKSNYTLSFSLTKEDIKNIAKTSNIAKGGELILYKERTEPIGAGAIIVNGNPGYYPLKKFDGIQFWSGGEPDRDVIINLVEEGCDPYDENCEVMCSYLSGICDPLCYIDNKAEDVPCDFDCVDYDKNGVIDSGDLDGVCDLDCYNNHTDIQSAYDIDCIFRNREINDEICDPDTNGRLDGVCDPDCAKPNYICDFDCDGTVYDLAGKPLNDTDCYVCDKICNGFCSFACKPWEDPDCIEGFKGFFNLTECCNNTKCGLGENCENCLEDCPAGATCEDLNNICCPDSFDSDEFGCSGTKNLEKGESCSCDNQCNSSLECTETADTFMAYEKACCEPEKQWNGTNCTEGICPETISSCFNHWHWDHYGAKQIININIYACDYFEVCHDPVVQPIAKEIISCCNNKCEGNCHTLCSRALEDSGLAASDTETTRKKCYGLYAILGMGPAAKWTRGYQLHLEEPASIMFSSGTWMCTGYAIMLTTLLRSVGYEKNEAYGACSYNHMFNIVKFPGDTKHRIVDTVGNILCVKGMYTGGNYPYCGNFGSECGGCINDEGTFSCPSGVVC